jgi:hypothetical protein
VTEGGENCIDEAGKISGIGEIISDEGEARAKGRIRCHAFGDRRIDRSVTDDHVEISLRQSDHNARADPTHSARDGRNLRRRRWIRHSNSTLRHAIARCQQY